MSWTSRLDELDPLEERTRARLDAILPMEAAKGTVLFRPGDAVQGYVVVLEGRVGVHLVGPTGRDILLYVVEPGTSCIQSTLGLLGGDDYTGEAVVEAESRLVLVPRDVFLDVLSDEMFRGMVFRAFAGRMQAMMHLLEQVAFQKVEVRLAAYLLAQADETGHLAATQQEIASGIGSAREVVSRRLDALAKSGALTQERGHVYLTDRESLRRLAEAPLL